MYSIPPLSVIDPTLIQGGGASTAPANFESRASSSAPAISTDTHSDSEHEDSSVSRSGPVTRRPRLRITRKNPVYGLVAGAMRGSKKYEIVRTKALRPPLAEQVEASARFLRCAGDIIERCERLSNETGCWLFFSAQHLFAQGPFLHYTSPRLLKEAKKDAEQITNHFNRVFLSLIASRNEESKEMHKRLVLAEEDKKAATEALAAAKEAEHEAMLRAESAARQLELQAEELAAQRLEFEALKARMRLDQRKNGAS